MQGRPGRERCLKPSLQREQVLFVSIHSNSLLEQNYYLQNHQEKVYLLSMKTNTLIEKTRLTNNNTIRTPQPLDLYSFMNKIRTHFFCSSLNVKLWPLSSFECKTQETPIKCIRRVCSQSSYQSINILA